MPAVPDNSDIKASNAVSISNLKQIGAAVPMYSQDYDEIAPPMKTSESAKKLLSPYARDTKCFYNPATKQLDTPNRVLSIKNILQMKSKQLIALYFEASPSVDGTRGIVFLDGHTARIPDDKWPAIKKRSHIP